MLIFALDTCCMAATAAIMDDDRLIAQTFINHKKTHSQKMLPQIETMFSQAEIDIMDIDCYAAAIGPGSFTGVRIGVATVKAFAQAADKPCVGISTLEALANNASFYGEIISPILDARRAQVYNALFMGSAGADLPKRLCEDRALALDELLDELDKMNKGVLFLGDGTAVYRDRIIERMGGRACFAQRMSTMNLAASVAEVADRRFQRGEIISADEMAPAYIRLSQAERERLEKMGQMGR